MTKQTKLYLGIGLVAVAGYFVWKQSKKTDKKNASGKEPLFSKTKSSGVVSANCESCGTCTKSRSNECLSGYILNSSSSCKCIGCATATEVQTNCHPTV
jgi:hypothetical protein